jgi:ubiquinone/menaquinone biosynthesis C-methylase UbiE
MTLKTTDLAHEAEPKHAMRDYRTSHLEKGEEYDGVLRADPMDTFMAGREAAILRQTVPRLFPRGLNRYLDFACGTGRILSCVGEFARETYGVDVSQSMLEQARQKCPEATLIHADLTRHTESLTRFNLVTAFRFFGNAEDGLRRAVLSALHELLEPGGYLVLNDHRNPWSLHDILHERGNGPCDLHHLKLRKLLREHGFNVVRTYGIGWWIVLDRQNRHSVLQSRWGGALEAVPGAGRLLAFVCPDAIIVARKR